MRRFVAIEGIDGSGKSSLSKELCHIFSKRPGQKTNYFTEPTKTFDEGKKIRQILAQKHDLTREDNQELLRLFFIDRKKDLEHNIRPALERGDWVFLDRYFFSTAAYQTYSVEHCREVLFSYLNDADFLLPGAVIYLRLEPSKALERIERRIQQQNIARETFEKSETLEGVYQRYESIIKQWPQLPALKSCRLIILDTDCDLPSLCRQATQKLDEIFTLS